MRYLLLSILFTLPLLSSAAGFSFEAEALSPAGTTEVTLYVLPEGETVYTAQAVVRFDESVFSMSNVKVDDSLRELSKDGYDMQTVGEVTKTAGFPGGVSTKTALLTFTLTKSTEGVSSISIDGTSALYNMEGENVATEFGTKSFGTVVEKTVAVAVLPPAFSISEDVKEVLVIEEEVVAVEPLEEVTNKITLPAAVITIDGPLPVVPLAILLLVIIMMLWVYIRMKSKRNMLAKTDIK